MKKDSLSLIEFLSPEAKKNFEDGVVELLLDSVKKDLEERSHYLIDPDVIIEKIEEIFIEMTGNIAEDIKKQYASDMEKLLANSLSAFLKGE